MLENYKKCLDGHKHQLEGHNHSNHNHHEHGHEDNTNKEPLQIIKTKKWKRKNFASSEKTDVTEALLRESHSFLKLPGHFFNLEAGKVRECDPQVLAEPYNLRGEGFLAQTIR